MKVVYISTPMKVNTSASKFREIVQELTGRQSDVVRIMETSGGNDTWTVPDDYHKAADDHHMIPTSITTSDDGRVLPHVLDHGSSPNSSSSEELVDDAGVFFRGQDSNFGIFDNSASLFYDHFFHQLDVLGSY
ncbi:Sigma factor binding protein 1 chloroplastic [Bienertia sinuspersici]